MKFAVYSIKIMDNGETIIIYIQCDKNKKKLIEFKKLLDKVKTFSTRKWDFCFHHDIDLVNLVSEQTAIEMCNIILVDKPRNVYTMCYGIFKGIGININKLNRKIIRNEFTEKMLELSTFFHPDSPRP